MNGKQHGVGTITLPEGERKEGLWDNGKRVRWTNIDETAIG